MITNGKAIRTGKDVYDVNVLITQEKLRKKEREKKRRTERKKEDKELRKGIRRKARHMGPCVKVR